ncbi:hypothetical protein O181_108207 [Austropuccinia psidii MF-1]|uniref:Helicase C-terminal domain-containing protein n=1 Tax=Austropuccinia psidii MF-1 TaxID=1389203 RepID=A0A9Q3PQ61_9BASI|nr:hypothetical protein [Austropuccinia psidii MF-1]
MEKLSEYLYTDEAKEEKKKSERRNLLVSIQQLRRLCNHPILAETTSSREEVDYSNFSEVQSMSSQCDNEPNYLIKKITTSQFLESWKILELMKLLKQEVIEVPEAKCVIYSQWTQFLYLIGIVLVHKVLSFSQIDGKNSSNNQQKALLQFSSLSDCKILLASLIAAGTGLNITCAQIVFIMDPHWNPSQESQAIDRLHRIGQSSIVKVFRFISQDTIEINIQSVRLSLY